jgi:hypothetical protein
MQAQRLMVEDSMLASQHRTRAQMRDTTKGTPGEPMQARMPELLSPVTQALWTGAWMPA